MGFWIYGFAEKADYLIYYLIRVFFLHITSRITCQNDHTQISLTFNHYYQTASKQFLGYFRDLRVSRQEERIEVWIKHTRLFLRIHHLPCPASFYLLFLSFGKAFAPVPQGAALVASLFFVFCAWGGNRTHTPFRTLDFKSRLSTSFSTQAVYFSCLFL
jgi:hypothetical protein